MVGAFSERLGALRRILEMTPLPLDSPLVIDEVLRAQLLAAQAEVEGSSAGE